MFKFNTREEQSSKNEKCETKLLKGELNLRNGYFKKKKKETSQKDPKTKVKQFKILRFSMEVS